MLLSLLFRPALLFAGESLFDLIERDADEQELRTAGEQVTIDDLETEITAGANIRARTGDGLTALHVVSAFTDNPEVIRSLVRAGAEVDNDAPGGVTPLMFAAALNPNPEIVKALLVAGADVTARDDEGKSALDRVNQNMDLWGTTIHRKLYRRHLQPDNQSASWQYFLAYEGFETDLHDADFMRERGPTAEHIRVYFTVRNLSEREILGIEFATRYMNVFGDTLHEGKIVLEGSIEPFATNPQTTYWYLENNPYISDQPYNRISSSASAGTLRISIAVTRIAFEDGEVKSFGDDQWVEPVD